MSSLTSVVLSDRRSSLRRWAAVTLLLFAWAAVLYVAVLGAVVDGFLQTVDLPCEPACLSVDHADIARVRDLLHEHGRYAAAYDLYFPRLLLIDVCVVALVGSAVAVRGRQGDVSAVRFSGAAALVLLVGCQIVFWEAINVATLVTE